jgi:hypothetical protein
MAPIHLLNPVVHPRTVPGGGTENATLILIIILATTLPSLITIFVLWRLYLRIRRDKRLRAEGYEIPPRTSFLSFFCGCCDEHDCIEYGQEEQRAVVDEKRRHGMGYNWGIQRDDLVDRQARQEVWDEKAELDAVTRPVELHIASRYL